ncbi:hypothetical protein [uncultured Thermosynechococcus sp.]|uniref:hypothetical protein n=1 Tax=uncultured Thermosynechococcus sp. TaxID=436945 RepID=UPI0026106F01|nr:hypothetical protein [uncultured Thermosynechococcus sp.]
MAQLSPLGQRAGVNPVQVSVKLTAFYSYLLQFPEPRVITENVQRQGFAPIAGLDN